MGDDTTPSIRELVEGAAEKLIGMRYHGELHSWARRHGINNGPRFNEFKRCLRLIGVDYDLIRERWGAAIERVQRGEIDKLVREHSDELQSMSFDRLNAWADDNGIVFGIEIGRFKSALAQVGVDWYALRREAHRKLDGNDHID